MLDFRAVLVATGLAIVLAGCRGAPATPSQADANPTVAPATVREPVPTLAVVPAPAPEPAPEVTEEVVEAPVAEPEAPAEVAVVEPAPPAPQAEPEVPPPAEGSPRAEVERVLGAPVAELDAPEGRWLTYRCVMAKEVSVTANEVVALGPYEVAAAPAEETGDVKTERIKVLYDAESDRISQVCRVN